MGAAEPGQASSPSQTYLLAPILLLFALLVIATLRAPNLISSAGIGSAVIVASPLVLATYALTFIAMAGRAGVDLSIGPLIGFINVSMVQLHAAGIVETPVEFFAYAIAVGVLYQLLMGAIIVYVRVQPIIVALSGFLALAGLNLVILPRPGGTAPEWMQSWGLGTEIFSPVLAIVVVATLAWFALTRTAFFDHLRLMGADERTAYASGVRIEIVRLGAHAVAGVYAAMAALTFTSLIGSGDPNQGTTYTLMAVTALVLGGTSLVGGRGSIVGSLLGALNIYLITYVLSTFSFGRVQSFVTEAAYGAVLVVSLLLTLALPRLPRPVARVPSFAVFVLLGVVAFGVILYAKQPLAPPPATAPASGETGSTVLGPAGSGGSGLTVLGGGGSGLLVLGGGTPAAAAPEPSGTAVVYAAIAVAAVVFLVFLLSRGMSISLIAFIAILVLLVLGLSLHGGPGPPSSAAVAADPGPKSFLLEWMGPAAAAAMPGALFASPVAPAALVAAGGALLGSFLVLIARTGLGARIAAAPLFFLLALGVAAAVVAVYASGGISASRSALFTPALGALLVGVLLFVVNLPRLRRRTGDPAILPLLVLAAAALGAMYFAAGSGGSEMSQAPAAAVPAAVGQLDPSEALHGALFWVIAAAAALYIGTLRPVRRRIAAYAAESIGERRFSYGGAFIVAGAAALLGAVFHAAGAPLWKLGVAAAAAAVAARHAWKFLRRYRGARPTAAARR